MRPWVLLRQAGIPFEEVQLKFDDSDGGLRVAGIENYSAAGKVPVLMIDGEPVWDSLAICETVAEMYPGQAPVAGGRRSRAAWRARSAPRCTRASRHLRGAMPMNIRSRYPGKGMTPAVAQGHRPHRRALDRVPRALRRRGQPAVRQLHRRRRLLRAGGDALPGPTRSSCRAVAQEYCEAVLALSGGARVERRGAPRNRVRRRRRALRIRSENLHGRRRGSRRAARPAGEGPRLRRGRRHARRDGASWATSRSARISRCSCIPKTHEEYALARTERKTGRGYHGFTVLRRARRHARSRTSTRRDLTINAIAKDEDGTLIDPFGGRRTLRRECCATSARRSPKTRCASCASRASRRASASRSRPKPWR